jgi:hypothetical protein
VDRGVDIGDLQIAIVRHRGRADHGRTSRSSCRWLVVIIRHDCRRDSVGLRTNSYHRAGRTKHWATECSLQGRAPMGEQAA